LSRVKLPSASTHATVDEAERFDIVLAEAGGATLTPAASRKLGGGVERTGTRVVDETVLEAVDAVTFSGYELGNELDLFEV